MKYQVKVFNPVTGTFKMVGDIKNTAKECESLNKAMCITCWKTGLMVVTHGF